MRLSQAFSYIVKVDILLCEIRCGCDHTSNGVQVEERRGAVITNSVVPDLVELRLSGPKRMESSLIKIEMIFSKQFGFSSLKVL